MPNRRLVIMALERPSGANWEATLGIYRQAFPAWEREPEDLIAERITRGCYQLKVGIRDEKVIGFYLLDLNTDPPYVILSFLAVDVRHRGLGFGTLLCRDAMTSFKKLTDLPWLFIEARERQAVFYSRIGFFKLVLDYKMPLFDQPGSRPMHLMVFPSKKPPASIEGAELTRILQSLFVQGYQLNRDDLRIAEQLARVENNVELTTWPEDKGV